jgi:hypothetical protein
VVLVPADDDTEEEDDRTGSDAGRSGDWREW